MSDGLLIRADADERIGAGHVMRCLAIAQVWRDTGKGPIWLASSGLPDRLRDRYEREGARVLFVEPGEAALSRAVRDTNASWVVLDGYAFGVRDQEAVRREGRQVLVVDDDGAVGRYVAHLVVDANVFAEEGPYVERSATTRLLLGPRYALLRKELRRDTVTDFAHENSRRLLVTFGGADPAGLSLVVLQALHGVDVEVTLVVGPANPRREDVLRAGATAGNFHVVSDVANMRDLMDATGLALVAAGSTCLELAHAGVPQLVVATAQNQRRVAEALAARGVARSLGDANQLTARDVRDAVISLVGDAALRRDMGTRGAALVDGLGAERVVEAMSALQTAPPRD